MQLKMLGKVCHFTFIFTCCSACVFGANNKNTQKRSTSETHWFRERISHNGLTLSDNDLTKVAQLGDERHFKQTLGPILIPRVVDTPGHTAVRKFIIDEMESLNWTVESHRFNDRTPVGRKTFTNVIATLDPSARRRLVLACHYDSKITPTGFLGATDSAVPCSMMINLAHVMKGSLKELSDRGSNVTLQFLFFDGEEAFKRWSDTDSLYGARKLAHKLHNTPFPTNTNKYDTSELHRIDLFVLLDLIGTEDCKFTSLFENSQRWYDKLVSYERNLIDLNLMTRRTPMFKARTNYGARIEDDHVPFLQRGVPILHLISAPFPSVWHKISDNGNALHYPSIANMNSIMRAFVTDYLHLKL